MIRLKRIGSKGIILPALFLSGIYFLPQEAMNLISGS
jgi:hypothetical protein